MAYQNFYELEVLKSARRLKRRVFELMKRFPSSEKYELISQLSRASRSVLANIAEGHGRQTAKDELHFAIMARGSLTEVLNHLIDARDSEYLDDAELSSYKDDWDGVRRILNGYVSYLRGRVNSQKAHGYVTEKSPDELLDIFEDRDISDENFIGKINDDSLHKPEY